MIRRLWVQTPLGGNFWQNLFCAVKPQICQIIWQKCVRLAYCENPDCIVNFSVEMLIFQFRVLTSVIFCCVVIISLNIALATKSMSPKKKGLLSCGGLHKLSLTLLLNFYVHKWRYYCSQKVSWNCLICPQWNLNCLCWYQWWELDILL